jgi:hypothetical protein
LKSAQLPNVIENSIQISRTLPIVSLPIVLGSIAKMNFEKKKKEKKSKFKI